MLHYLPGEQQALPPRPQMQDVVVQLFTHHTIVEPILVPAVVEPLLVLVLAGAANIEERSFGGEWEAANVQAGDFFLTNTSEPYEMRWQTQDGDTFEVMHLYLGLPLIDQAARDLLGKHATPVTFLDVSGARDERVRLMLDQLRIELISERQPSPLFTRSLAQALAVHLVRTYLDPHSVARRGNALQAYKLRRVIEAMSERLADDFSLTHLAEIADLSEYHFSRMFKRATGLSPSQYFIRLRMARARHLLLETDRSIIDIGMEVGYSSPSHFSQVFRREVGITPRAYRQA
ncbi:helix-turn-helix domain-containing protein [Azotobacter chroococcum]|uniref:Helix-turn-helix domain-containing protein n=1 Tax=Azotobacter chroococcum TaxID=353 RepID=A0AAP9YLN3_9GAMM|nr:helix-turn-helix domain-containing protein [Azotobacter chroococcum]QQE91279.1 helix-turn-helix domain-containing protein [Azotobacter chroococcum]